MGQNATCKESKRKNFGDVLAHHHGVVTLEGVRVAACNIFTNITLLLSLLLIMFVSAG